ncbi:glycosyltransferase family 4 protein [Geotalea toluenoxydans]
MPDNPIKVIMLAPTPYFSDRGCHVRIYEEAKALRQLGVDVRIVTYHLGRDLGQIPTYRACRIPWYKKVEAGPSWQKPYLDILLLFKAMRIARTFSPDLIHAHLHEGALVGFFLKKWLQVPLLFDYQGSLTAEISAHRFIKKKSLLHKVFAGLERTSNNLADFIVTSSSPSASALVNDWHMQANRVQALIDGVDTDDFRPYSKMACRIELNLPQDVPIVGFLGLLNEYQGIDILLEAISILKGQNTRLFFLVMGFPEAEYVKKAKDSGLDSIIRFTGRIDYSLAPKYLSACDLAVSPKISLSEANGKLFNYMACGLPTIVFDTPVNREILGETGAYAAYGNASDLAVKIAMLATNTPMIEELSEKSREKAVQKHSWRARGETLLELYRGLLKKSKA